MFLPSFWLLAARLTQTPRHQRLTGGTQATDPPTDVTEAPDATTTAAPLIGEGRLVGMAFDIGGRGDLSFNDLAAAAWDDGMAMFGYGGDELSPDTGGTDREENLRLLAETGHELIIANGFAFNQNVWRVGTENPDTHVRHHRRLPIGRHLRRC